jgi:hypothetical protein
VWPDADAFLGARPEPDYFRPGMDDEERQRLSAAGERAVDTALHWARSDA